MPAHCARRRKRSLLTTQSLAWHTATVAVGSQSALVLACICSGRGTVNLFSSVAKRWQTMGSREYAKLGKCGKVGPGGIGCPCCNPFGQSPRKSKPAMRRIKRRVEKQKLKKENFDG